jgi:hypothetical protein
VPLLRRAFHFHTVSVVFFRLSLFGRIDRFARNPALKVPANAPDRMRSCALHHFQQAPDLDGSLTTTQMHIFRPVFLFSVAPAVSHQSDYTTPSYKMHAFLSATGPTFRTAKARSGMVPNRASDNDSFSVSAVA